MNGISPRADGGAMSHWARAKAKKNTISLPFLDSRLKSRGIFPRNRFQAAKDNLEFFVLDNLRLGQISYLAKGNNGTAFLARRAGAAMHNRLFGALTYYVMGSPVKAPKEVIIKVQGLKRFTDINDVR